MSTVSVRVHFHLPVDEVREYLNSHLIKVSQLGPQRLELTARLPATHIDLSKAVMVEFLPHPNGVEGAWRVRWTPEPGGIYPSFDGTLYAHAYGETSSVLELTGSYTPPLGAVGVAFDHVLGHKISEDTARIFLLNLSAELKVRSAYEDAFKVFHPANLPEERTVSGEEVLEPKFVELTDDQA